MADDLNRLLIKIQADTSQLSSALQRAEAGVAQSSARLERTVDRNANKFKKWGDELAGQFKRMAAGFAGLELITKGLDAIGNVAGIAKAAAAADLTATQFQELAHAARVAGAGTEELTEGLSKFAENMAGVRLNTGAFNDFLREQAPALRDALAATTDQSQAVRIFSDALTGLGDRGQKATLTQAAFGRSSKDLIDVLDKGSASLSRAADEAHKLGLVQTDELLESAKNVQKAYVELQDQVTATFQVMAVEAAKAVGPVVGALDKILDKVAEGAKKSLNGQGPGLFGFNMGPMPQIPGQTNGGEGTSLDLFAPKTTGWDATVKKSPSWSLQKKPDNTGRDALANLQKQFDQSNGDIQKVLQDQYDQELRQWQDMLDKKQITEAQFAEARTQLGIMMLNSQKENLGAETQMQREYYTQTRDLINSTFMDAFAGALDTGKFKASEFFNSMLKGFAKITMEVLVLKPLLDGLFSGMSGGGGLLGSLFGGFLAAGGPADAKTPYIVGERGPELFVPNSSGRVKNARETAEIFTPSLGNARGGNSISNSSTVINNTIDARGADVGVADRLAKVMNSQRQQSPVTAMKQAAKRFPTRG